MFPFRRPSRLTGGLWLAFLSILIVALVVLLV